MKQLVRNYPLLLVVLTLTILSLALFWLANKRDVEFTQHQQKITEQSVNGTASEITLLLEKLRQTLSLLAETHEEKLWQLSNDPDNDEIYHELEQHVATYLPDYFWLTVANKQGEVLYNDFGEKVGELCLADIRRFIKSEQTFGHYIHPGPEDYHFDVMAPWSHTGKGKGVFFVSFKPRVIARLLQNSEVLGHQLILLRNDVPGLIEITSHGGRDELDRPIHLSEEELNRISFSKKLTGTRWTLVDLPDANLFSLQRTHIRNQIITVLIIFLMISGIMLWLIRDEENKRRKVETSLRDSHMQLESRVVERTEELVRTNSDLQSEILERTKVEGSLEFLAHHDVLTGLPNRVLLHDRLQRALAQAHRTSKQVAILFLDLDNFKLVNDSLGHHSGDELLKTIGERLASCLRASDTISRLAGDEFTVILEYIDNIHYVSLVAHRILKSIEKQMLIDGHEVSITTSIGISMYPADGQNIDDLLKHADSAMYRAKQSGNAYMFYTAEMTAHTLERLDTQNQLRHALERDEFVLHYQCRIDIQTGKPTGFEALLRWRHPKLGLVPPVKFIHLLEETGLIIQVGEWVLRTACEFNKTRLNEGQPPLRVSVNLSARQFNDKQLINKVTQCLEVTGMDPEYLELEVTESSLIENIDDAIRVLDTFHAMGIQISIDDFGTGYSSLSYLKRFPINALKIDRSFIMDVTEDTDDAIIVSTIITMAHNLGITVTAEGVETQDQLEFLRDKSCDEAQGYLYSKPIPADAFEAWLDAENHKETATCE